MKKVSAAAMLCWAHASNTAAWRTTRSPAVPVAPSTCLREMYFGQFE
jgi:hypothetical protein